MYIYNDNIKYSNEQQNCCVHMKSTATGDPSIHPMVKHTLKNGLDNIPT